MIRQNVSCETVFLCVRENVGKDVFTRRYCMWKLRGVIVIFIRRDKPRLLTAHSTFDVGAFFAGGSV